MSEEHRIADRCPSCGSQSLFIGSGGWLTCSVIGCNRPALQQSIEWLVEAIGKLRGAVESLAHGAHSGRDYANLVLSETALSNLSERAAPAQGETP